MTSFGVYHPHRFLSTLCSGTIVLVAFVFLLHPFPADPDVVVTAFDMGDKFRRGQMLGKTFAVVSSLFVVVAAGFNWWLLYRCCRELVCALRTSGLAAITAHGRESSLHAVPLALALNVLVNSVVCRTILPLSEGVIQILIGLSLLALGICATTTACLLIRSFCRFLRTRRYSSLSSNNNLHLAAYALSLQGIGFLACGRPSAVGAVSAASLPIAYALASVAGIVSAVAVVWSILSISRRGVTLYNSGIFWIIVPVLTTQSIVLTARKHPGGVLSAAPAPTFSTDSFLLYSWLFGVLIVQTVLFVLCLILATTHPVHRGQLDGTSESNPMAFLISLPGVNFALLIAYDLQVSLIPLRNPAFGTPGYFTLGLVALFAVAASVTATAVLLFNSRSGGLNRRLPGDLPAGKGGG